MDNKDEKGQQEKSMIGTAGESLEKARSTIMRTISAVAAGFTDMSGGTVPPPKSPIPAKAPPGTCSSNGSTSGESPEKKPKNMMGLLQMCADLATQGESSGVPASNQVNAADAEERQKFLNEAIQSFAGTKARTVIDDLKDAITLLDKDLSNPSIEPEKNIQNLKLIAYHVDDLDLANDFLKIGGLRPVMKGLAHEHGPVRKESYNILAVVAQNNPFAWTFYEQHDVLATILERLVGEGYDEAFDYGFSAVSCLIRGNSNAIMTLKANGGEDLIYTIMLTSERTKTLRKAGYILRSLMLHDKEQNGPTCEVRGFYKAILQELCDRIRLKKGPRDVLGAALQIIYYILSEHEELVQGYSKPELGLIQFVEDVLKVEPTDDDSLEVMETYNAASDLKPLLVTE